MKTRIIAAAAALVGAAAIARGQSSGPTPPAETIALRACAELADRGQPDSAAAIGRPAEAAFRKRIARNPRDVEALVGLGRTLAQCLLPVEDDMGKGTMSTEAMETLENALDLAPTNWTARFMLAMIAYRSPAFLGRGDIAARHFDELLRQQGNRASDPMFARVYEYRGMQLMRAGKPDSARALWTRGLMLFPDDSALAAVMKRSNEAAHTSHTATAIPMMTITARADRAPAEPPAPPAREVTRGEIVSTAGGAADVFNAVQMQPGATLVGEGSSVYTRGGDAAETITLLDGARVLSLDRFEGLNGGLFGALEPWVVKSVRYSTGAFSARHGNALSGVVEIETEGKPRERRTRAGVSLVQASGTSWLPAGRKAGGWISARVSQTAALLATHGRTAEFDGAPHSEEVIASMIATPTPGTELRATTLMSSDASRRIVSAAGWVGPFRSTGDSRAIQLSGRWQGSAPVTVAATVNGATRATEFGFGVLSRRQAERTLGGRVDATYDVGGGMVLRGGLEQAANDREQHGTIPASPSVADGAPVTALPGQRSYAGQTGAYTEAELTRRGSVLSVGVRTDELPGEERRTVDPRASLSHRNGNWTMRVAGGVFHQGRWRAEAAIPDGGVPSGLPGTARHVVTTIEHEAGGRVLRVEAYRKGYSDYRAFGVGPQIESSRSRGVDVLAEHRTSGPITGWATYSYLDARAQLVDGTGVRSPFDVTHTLGASATARVSDWSLGLTARYGTGAPTTPVLGAKADANGFPRPVYGAPMSQRLPDFRRLDARVMRYHRMPRVLMTSFAEIINLTGQRNVSGVTWDAGYQKREYMHTFFSARTLVIGAEAQFR